MTDKKYKIEQWANGLYYSFPMGNIHNEENIVLERVEDDLNKLYEENELLKRELKDCQDGW